MTIGDTGDAWRRAVTLGCERMAEGEWDEAAREFADSAQAGRDGGVATQTLFALVCQTVAEIRAGSRGAVTRLLEQAFQTEAPAEEVALAHMTLGSAFASVRAMDCLEHYQAALDQLEALRPQEWFTTALHEDAVSSGADAFYVTEGCASLAALRLAELLLEMGRPDDAHRAASRGIEATEGWFDGPMVAAVSRLIFAELQMALGKSYDQSGDPESALASFIAYLEAINGLETERTAMHRVTLAAFFHRQGELGKSKAVYRSVIDAFTDVYQTESPVLLLAIVGLAQVFGDGGAFQEAREQLEEAQRMAARHGIEPENVPGLLAAEATLTELERATS
jgi:tetratricopeptide (TPR) repeat protein